MKHLSYFITAVVIATAVYFFIIPTNQNPQILNDTSSEAIETQALKTNSLSSMNGANAPAVSDDASVPKLETLEEKYLKQGFVQDPNNSNQMMKEQIGKDGKKIIFYVDKTETGFEPDNRTVKNALEILVSKRNSDPYEEVRTLARINEDNINSAMLNGHFRDDSNDIDAIFSSVTDENGEPSEFDKACFIAPKLGLNFGSSFDKYTVHTDETGYAIIQFSPNLFVRITWSYEGKRIIHGEVISIENGQSKNIKSFAAVQINRSRGEELKYCK